MLEKLFNFISKQQEILVLGVLLLFSSVEIFGGLLKNTQRSAGDLIQEITGFMLLSIVIKPLIVILVGFIGAELVPGYTTLLSAYNLWALLIVYLFIDDFLQYWYHRSAHEYAFLWKLHRPHHAANEMGLLVSYRNAALYYVLMPNIWWIAVMTFLGGGVAVGVGLIIKQLVIISSHSTTRWDRVLYRFKVLSPLAWFVEHIIVTPAFHFAHHGKAKDDGISDPNGNFGNMFSIWDQLFGSALFTREYPKEYGLQSDTIDSWQSHTFYPIIYAKDSSSEIAKGFQKVFTRTNSPIQQTLSPGIYLWCSCGFSRKQPFCDGSHQGTKHKPQVLKVEEEQIVKLCNCKRSKLGAICDNSHNSL